MSAPARAPTRWRGRVGGPYPVESVLPLLFAGETALLDGFRVKFGSTRLQTFVKGRACVHCGLAGSFFTLDQDFGGGIHLNLYATAADGAEVLMTSDHIVPRSGGGADKDPANRQPLCEPCNTRKDSFQDPSPGDVSFGVYSIPTPLRKATGPVTLEELRAWIERRRQFVNEIGMVLWPKSTCTCGANHTYDNPGCEICDREIGGEG